MASLSRGGPPRQNEKAKLYNFDLGLDDPNDMPPLLHSPLISGDPPLLSPCPLLVCPSLHPPSPAPSAPPPRQLSHKRGEQGVKGPPPRRPRSARDTTEATDSVGIPLPMGGPAAVLTLVSLTWSRRHPPPSPSVVFRTPPCIIENPSPPVVLRRPPVIV